MGGALAGIADDEPRARGRLLRHALLHHLLDHRPLLRRHVLERLLDLGADARELARQPVHRRLIDDDVALLVVVDDHHLAAVAAEDHLAAVPAAVPAASSRLHGHRQVPALRRHLRAVRARRRSLMVFGLDLVDDAGRQRRGQQGRGETNGEGLHGSSLPCPRFHDTVVSDPDTLPELPGRLGGRNGRRRRSFPARRYNPGRCQE